MIEFDLKQDGWFWFGCFCIGLLLFIGLVDKLHTWFVKRTSRKVSQAITDSVAIKQQFNRSMISRKVPNGTFLYLFDEKGKMIRKSDSPLFLTKGELKKAGAAMQMTGLSPNSAQKKIDKILNSNPVNSTPQ